MGLNLRYSPLEWNENTKSLELTNATNFIKITGTVANFAKLSAGTNGSHCLFTNAAVCAVATSHALQIDIDGTAHYIPVFSDLSWGA